MKKNASKSDIRAETVSKILNYIYLDNVSLENVEAAIFVELLYGAKKFLMKELVKKCVDKINSPYGKDIKNNFPLVMLLSTPLHSEINKKNCLEGMQFITRSALASEMFMKAPFELINDFISYINANNLEPKALIFEFLLKWGKKECEKEGILATNENIMSVIKKNKFEPMSYLDNFTVTDIINIIRKRNVLCESQITDLVLKRLGACDLNDNISRQTLKSLYSMTISPGSNTTLQAHELCPQLFIVGFTLTSYDNGFTTIKIKENDNCILAYKVSHVSKSQIWVPDIAFYPSYTCDIAVNDISQVSLQWSESKITVKASNTSRIRVIYYK
ncbi:uncharacterized protein LOC135930255 [Gordionus sp. m RMFG-2023]|uniref:uncharacterized protein LOC135930255 n=1 Tax=Gordionus sp. m RMFG-2023 TaxID=3053472 RepID=UPI0031FC56F3